jgi:hypothetical protein
MRELGIVLGITLIIASVSALTLLPWRGILYLGGLLVLSGFAVGLPAGFIYHVQLYRALGPLQTLPKGWFWRPIPLNKRLMPHDRIRVLPWCYVGGLGFFAIIIGLIVFTVGMVEGLTRGP